MSTHPDTMSENAHIEDATSDPKAPGRPQRGSGVVSSALLSLAPYYEDSHITLYHGDCVEIMGAMDGVSVDAVITDPPYCSGGALEAQKNSGGQGHRSERLASGEVEWFAADNMTTGGLVWLVRAVLLESRRVMKANRSAFVFTDWRMVPQYDRVGQDECWPRNGLQACSRDHPGIHERRD